VALLPIKPFTVEKAASVWKMDRVQTQNLLETLAGRALLVDVEQNGQSTDRPGAVPLGEITRGLGMGLQIKQIEYQ